MPAENSTNVRTTSRVPWTLRAGLKALGAISLPLAARAGERLFLTPQRHRAPEREREALAGARAFEVASPVGRLKAWRFGKGPAVLLVHGWSGRGGQLVAFAPPLVEAGLSVVTFDAPAHGGSGGRLASVPIFAEAIQAVSARVGGVRAVIAHSMGGAGTTLALTRGLELDAAVFVGPPRNPARFFETFGDALQLSLPLRRAARARLEARLGLRLEQFDVARYARSLTTPLLVVHDRDDAEIAWADGAAVAEHWPGAELMTTEGLGHRRLLRAPEVVRRAAAFVAERVATRCECGRPAQASARGAFARLCAACALGAELFDRSLRWPQAA